MIDPDLTTAEEDGPRTVVMWVLVLILYVVLGYWFKTVFLNWIIGPIFPFVLMYLVPAIWQRLTQSQDTTA
jgi:hypothetical protein